ncbi:MAG: hypothetical protein ACRECV_04220 [Xanthobacteraceae bacterium]
MAITSDPLGLFPFKGQSGRSNEAAGSGGYRVGSIIFDSDPNRCQEIKFDNVTGGFSEPGPCDSKVIGFNGKPMPMGTFSRLESIRQSFVGHQQRESSSATGE